MKKTATIEISTLINIQGIESTIAASIIYRRDIKQGYLLPITETDTLIPKCIVWLTNAGFTHYKLNNKTISI